METFNFFFESTIAHNNNPIEHLKQASQELDSITGTHIVGHMSS